MVRVRASSLRGGAVAGQTFRPAPGSNLEPLEHSVLNAALVARPMEGIPLEHSVLGMALDSGLTEGVSQLEPLEHSILNVALDKA